MQFVELESERCRLFLLCRATHKRIFLSHPHKNADCNAVGIFIPSRKEEACICLKSIQGIRNCCIFSACFLTIYPYDLTLETQAAEIEIFERRL